MAVLISGNQSVDLLSFKPFSMPLNNSSVDISTKESDANIKSSQRVEEINGSSDNNASSAISSKGDPILPQVVRFIHAIPMKTGHETGAQHEISCALNKLKADPNDPRRKRRRTVRFDSQPSSYSKQANGQDLSSWLGKPLNDTDTNINNASTDTQKIYAGSEIDSASTTKLLIEKPNTKPCENVTRMSAGGTSEVQEPLLGPQDVSTQLSPTQMSREECKFTKNTGRKMLKLNSKGKLGSPPTKIDLIKTEPSKGTGKYSLSGKLIAVLKYGHKEEIRRRVAEIVEKKFNWRTSMPNSQHCYKEGVPANQLKSDKSVHPFFNSKQKLKVAADAQGGHKELVGQAVPQRDELQPRKCTVTPGKLRAQRQDCVEATESLKGFAPLSQLPPRNSAKTGGNSYPWPSKANLHVRGLAGTEIKTRSPRNMDSNIFKENRKLKGVNISVAHKDDIMRRLSQDLRGSTSSNLLAAPQDYTDWIAPTRQITTGPELVKWFSKKLFASRNATNSKIQRHGNTVHDDEISMHPAVERLHNETESTLTPFDEFTCESALWTSKYSPKSADQVLQSRDCAIYLRDWLRSLSLQAKQNGKNLSNSSNLVTNRNSSIKRGRPKKRRKVDGLDGFIASSDEESGREEPNGTTSENNASILKDRNSNMLPGTSACDNRSNAVLITGPHGCGKTAAVYAVAEELGFEVFEINPGSRRTGRDILDKVGEMAENHLVQPVTDPSVSNKVDGLGLEELPVTMIEPVSQRSMKSFFGPKSKPESLKNKVEDDHERSFCKPNGKIQRGTPRQQKQSLILLEEADVLFDKDKQFWPTVVSLLAYSKRPIIMTCTDERFIPHELVAFQATLRFSPPPRNTTVDYLMILAGKEGHKLSRDAVSSIFDQTSQDLRACIMVLNFWCQMGVGDKKGGLDWMINRWPAGVDLDEFGRKLRVVSNHTFRNGMGLSPNDLCFAKNSVIYDRDCELLRDACNNKKIDLELLYNTNKCERNTVLTSEQILLQEKRPAYQQLVEAEIMSDTWSFADYFTKEQLDSAEPFLPEKTRADTPEGVSILPVESVDNFTSFTNHIAITSLLLSSELHPKEHPKDTVADSASISPSISAAIKAGQSRCADVCIPNYRSLLTSALSPLAPDSTTYSVLTSHTHSVLATEVAPYVRAIAAYDQALEIQRASRLASFGGRLTRAARSVVEGVERGKVRRDRWIPGLNIVDTLQTASGSWRAKYCIASEGEEEDIDGSAKNTRNHPDMDNGLKL